MVYTVHYFPFDGRALVVRLALEFGGFEWRNEILSDENDYKQWYERKKAGFYRWNQVPALTNEELGKDWMRCQSLPILEWLSTRGKTRLIPEDEETGWRIRELAHYVVDVAMQVGAVAYGPEEGKADRAKAFLNEHLNAKFIPVLTRHLGDGPYFFGQSAISYADLLLFSVLEAKFETIDGAWDAWNASEPLKAWFNRIKTSETYVNYRKSDKSPPFGTK